MNEIVHRHTALPANFGESLMKGIADTRSTMMTGDGGKLLLRLLRTGAYVVGQNNEPVEKDAEFAVNIASLARGWVCWDDGELLGQVMASVQSERLPQPAPLNGTPFVEQFSMELTCISGDKDGLVVLYKNNSAGFKEAFEKLLGEIAMRWGADKVYFWPVITLEQTSYPHKKYGQIWKPIFNVMAWTDENGTFSPDSEAVEEESAPPPPVVTKPTRGRPRTELPANDYAADAPAPTAQTHVGQRRRPASR